MLAENYFKEINSVLQNVFDTQLENIKRAAGVIFEAAVEGRNIYAFGCNHAGIIAEELFFRAGGLAIINPIMIPGLTMETRPASLTTDFERLDGLGPVIVENYGLKSGDVLIIHSVSGRNCVPVDLAIHAKKIGVKVIVLTNMNYSEKEPSRHPSGTKLFEVCDIVIDNCGCYGDAAVEVKGFKQKVAPTSTTVGAAIVNAMVAEVVEMYVDKGMDPPIYMSSNMEGGDEYNNTMLPKYRKNIFYL